MATQIPKNTVQKNLKDQLLELLRTHESLGQEEFLQALRRQRSSEEVPQA